VASVHHFSATQTLARRTYGVASRGEEYVLTSSAYRELPSGGWCGAKSARSKPERGAALEGPGRPTEKSGGAGTTHHLFLRVYR
jgi:hypothetical protein